MTERQTIIQAVAKSWARETSEVPDLWQEANPALGHCDVSSFVAWEHLGGELVLGEVHRDGKFQEYHYWNRLDGADLDLTKSQFRNGEVITEKQVLSEEYLRTNGEKMRPELKDRICAFRDAVNQQLTSV